MPTFVNPSGVPAPIERAAILAFGSYDKGDAAFSISELLKPPRAVALERENQAAVVLDVADLMYALMGQIMARIIAENSTDLYAAVMAAAEGLPKDEREVIGAVMQQLGHRALPDPSKVTTLSERRLFMEIEVDGQRYRISGKFDHTVAVQVELRGTEGRGWNASDWKLGSVWEAMGPRPEREDQLNCYAALLRANQYTPVVALGNGFVFRDWSKPRAYRERDYPQSQFKYIPAAVWDEGRALDFLRERVRLHVAARAGNLPDCTLEEKWQDPDAYAVMKKGNKRASRVLPTQAQAEAWLGQQDEKKFKAATIVLRGSEPKRCISYCNAAPFCDQLHREFPELALGEGGTDAGAAEATDEAEVA